ncbi:adenosine deaminase [Acetobacter sp. AN02]|uniref:adenosine deaminase family protein n=1 Tax=Acetobacter sp. AN02 TaxID=2894186 RepID=UPI002434613E|nr:adenosine deaminase [Acetobacter sp. AN02]MDG6094248.1 adenosine deaminase [Acetobacter sp. AN02]
MSRCSALFLPAALITLALQGGIPQAQADGSSAASPAAGSAAAGPDRVAAETAAAKVLDSIRDNPARLTPFLRAFPKGADLHNHLVGAVWAEQFLDWAAADGLCADPQTGQISAPPCRNGMQPAKKTLEDGDARTRMIDALSMRDFVPTGQDRSGHDHFFATFAKFMPAANGHDGDMLASAMRQAARDHVLYLELMVSPRLFPAAKLGEKLDTDTEREIGPALDTLMPQMPAFVSGARADMDNAQARAHEELGCGTPSAEPACGVTVRYLYQTVRTMPPGMVLAQLALGYQLKKSDPRFVGVNIVAPEDDRISLRDYTLHMQMFRELSRREPGVPLSLHAGELSEKLVPPEDLRFHIRQAVEIAGARRIGHGVDIMQEDDPSGLMVEMAKKNILVEINLTSNDEILGVKGADHPLMTWRDHQVPVALSTDDEGVSRGSLTTEYHRAVLDYPLSYTDLKDISRAGLEYAFVPGDSLWETDAGWKMKPVCAEISPETAPQTGACHDFLAGNEKARLQWSLEGAFVRFERQAAGNTF